MRALSIFCLLCSSFFVPAQDPAPTVKVVILAGQSNMVGFGTVNANPKRNEGKGTLEYLVKNPKTAKQFAHLVNEKGEWVERDDVSIWYFEKKGKLTVGYGAKEGFIGPEMQFGHVMGDHFKEPVLIIKTAWGGKSLAVDFRSPSAGKIPDSYGERLHEAVKKNPEMVGKYYRLMLSHVKSVLIDRGEHFPQLKGKKVELVGFGWHQGWNDRVNQKFNDDYEKNMAHFIHDLRKDLGVKDLPIVIAETGMSGFQEKHPRAVSLMKAQAAVAARDEFKDNVAFVGTKAFFRPKEESPTGQAYHWNHNAETHFLMGDAMAKAMLKLRAKK